MGTAKGIVEWYTNTRFAKLMLAIEPLGILVALLSVSIASWISMTELRYDRATQETILFDMISNRLQIARTKATGNAGQTPILNRVADIGFSPRRVDARLIRISNAELRNLDLSKAKLMCTDVLWSDLSGANLTDAIMHEINILDTNLSDANLSRSSLYKAVIMDTEFYRTNLRYVNLHEVKLHNVDFRFANGLKQRQLETVCGTKVRVPANWRKVKKCAEPVSIRITPPKRDCEGRYVFSHRRRSAKEPPNG